MNVYFLRMTIKTAGEISQRKVLFDKMSSSHRGTDPRRSGFSRSHSYRHSIDLAGQEIQASVLYRMQALKWRRQQRLIHWRPDQDSAGSCHTAGLQAFVSTPRTQNSIHGRCRDISNVSWQPLDVAYSIIGWFFLLLIEIRVNGNDIRVDSLYLH